MTSPNLVDHFTELKGALSTLQQTVNNVAAMQAAMLAQLSQMQAPQAQARVRRFGFRRKPKAKLGAVDPNVGASPQSVADDLAGTDGGGNMLPWRKVAMFYEANIFGRSKDYAFTEGANVSASLLDHGASLAKLQTRCKTLADGNQYDAWDAIITVAKWVVANNLTINNDSPDSVNFKG